MANLFQRSLYWLRAYYLDVRDAGWRFSDLVWASALGGLLLAGLIWAAVTIIQGKY